MASPSFPMLVRNKENQDKNSTSKKIKKGSSCLYNLAKNANLLTIYDKILCDKNANPKNYQSYKNQNMKINEKIGGDLYEAYLGAVFYDKLAFKMCEQKLTLDDGPEKMLFEIFCEIWSIVGTAFGPLIDREIKNLS